MPSSSENMLTVEAAQQRQQQEREREQVGGVAWHAWLPGMLVKRGFASTTTKPDGAIRVRYYLADLAATIARALPEGPPVGVETLRNVVYRRALPSHHTARALAAALGVSEVAILLRSGQLDWDAVTPLLGSAPAILRSEQEYRDDVERAYREVPDVAFRARVLAMIEHEWRFTQELHKKLEWLGVTPEEWERIRSDLNSPAGRARFSRALYGTGSDQEQEPSALRLPQEFVDGL